jgi:hypothetical protein
MTFAVLGGLAGGLAGAAGIGGLTLASGAALGLAGGAALGSLTGTDAASKAADVQVGAANRAAELQRQTAQEQLALQKRIYEEGVARQQRWLTAGEEALNKLIPASEYTPFGQAQFQQDPGYAFRMSEGLKALDRQAAARGGLISGGALKAAQRYGQELGSQEYQNAFNRYQAERQARLGPLQSLAGVGQTTAQQMGAAGQQYAGQAGQTAMGMAGAVGDLMGSAAAARASGYVGGANALTGALGTGLNYYQNQQLLNRLLPAQTATYAAPTIAPVIGYQDPYARFQYGASA